MKGPNHPTLREREEAANFEAAEASLALLDHNLDHVFISSGRAPGWLVGVSA